MFGKSRSKFWNKVGYELAKSRRMWANVNLSKLERYAQKDNKIVVPGKVLGSGRLTKKLRIYAFEYSQSAKKGIAASGGNAEYLGDLFEKKPPCRELQIIK